jgi:hypothetical protein
MTEYERLHAFTALLEKVHQLLVLKGRTEAADVVFDEVQHFYRERDIARAAADLALDLDNPITTMDLGRLDDDDCPDNPLDSE